MNKVNVAYLEEVCGGSSEIIREMVEIFFEQVPEFLDEMNSLHAKGSYNDLGLLAHKAKSSVAIMGMEPLAARLKDLELKAKAGTSTGSYRADIDFFASETEAAIKELQNYLDSL